MDVRAGRFPETIRAVVVGVSRCLDPDLAELAAVQGETQSLGNVLVSPNACRIPAGQVSCLTAPPETTRAQILSALHQCASNAKTDDILFFYFAGHGVKSDGSFALVPSDGLTARPDTLITAADLGQSLAGTRARGIFMVADCCGGAAIYENARALFSGISDRLEFRILLSSSKEGESSWEISGRGSPFTAALNEALQGRMAGIGEHGEIYFTSLMAHVTSRVDELLNGEYSGLPPQHPNFDGSYEKDPLLFVNSDIAIGRLVLKTARYSPEYVRRRVRQTVGGLTAAAIITVVGYWTWLDQHYFLRLDGNNVALYHGYSNFPWPGMPQRLWQFDFYRALLNPESTLARGGDLLFAKERDVNGVLARLEPMLTTTGKIYLAVQTSNRDKARTIAKTALDTNDPTVNPSEVLGAYIAQITKPDDGDKAMLASIIQNDTAGAKASVAFPALLRIDTNQAIEAIKASHVSLNPNVLFGLRMLKPPCPTNVRNFLFKLIRSDQPNVAEFAMNAALQANCKESPLPFFVRASASQVKTFGYFGRFQSDAYRSRLANRVSRDLKRLAEADRNDISDAERDWTREEIEQLAFSGTGPCDMNLINYTMKMSPRHRLDIIDYLLNSCSNLSYQIQQAGDNAAEIILLDGSDVKDKVLMDFDENEELRDRAIDFVQRRDKIAQNGYLIDEPIGSYLRASGDLQATNADLDKALNALKWAAQLRYWSSTIDRLLADPQQPVSIRKWALFAALSAAPPVGTKMLIDRFDDFQFDYDGFVKMIVAANLPADSIKTIRDYTRRRGEHDIFYVNLTSLFGTTDEVVSLLLSPDAGDRATAVNFVEFRDDLPQIVAGVRRHPPTFDTGMLKTLDDMVADQKQIDIWLADVPDWALDWRIFIAARLYGNPTGFSLRHLAAINSRKARGIERPFAAALLKFSWQ